VQLVLLAHVEATLSAAHAAPVRALKQFKLPTANSEPRSTTNGSDGNLWFTLGGENANVPSKIGRITPAGVITEFGSACEFCTVTDIIQGPSDVLYYTSNNPVLGRITTSGEILDPIEIPNSNAVAGNLAVHGEEIWFTDFNNDSLWRYDGAWASSPGSTSPSRATRSSTRPGWSGSPLRWSRGSAGSTRRPAP
jgi:streptogramin lyase